MFAIEACLPSRSQLNELDGMLDNCIRRIFSIQSSECTSYIRDVFNIVSTDSYWLSTKCSLLHKIYCNPSPVFNCVFRLAFNECIPSITANGIHLNLPAIVQIRHLSSRCR